MKFFKPSRTILSICTGVLAFTALSSPAVAEKSTECLVVEEHGRNGQEAYGQIFDKAEKFLRDNKIEYYLYGKKHYYPSYNGYSTDYKEKYCSDVYGGCGADKFEIDVTLFPGDQDYPIVLITPKLGAKATEHGYVIVGKLGGLLNHKSCQGSSYINGQIWKADVSRGHILGNINNPGYVKTSLSQVGTTLHKRYYTGLLPSYEGKTLVIKVDDFGNGPNYSRFKNIIDSLPGSGVIYQR